LQSETCNDSGFRRELKNNLLPPAESHLRVFYFMFYTKELLDCFAKHSAAIEMAAACRTESINRPFKISVSDWNSLVFNIEARQWFTLHCYYGHAFMIGLLKYYEQEDNYEICAEIKKDIELMSNVAKEELSTNSYPKYDVRGIAQKCGLIP